MTEVVMALAAPPELEPTSAVLSAALAIRVGCRVGSTGAGAAELPPEAVAFVPTSVAYWPKGTGRLLAWGGNPETALAMRCIAFSVLLLVSFCEMAGMTTPLTLLRIVRE